MLKYSIIVAVYNRLDEVKELLGSAEYLDFDRNEFELILVDDDSKDGFREFISNYKSNSGLNISVFYKDHKGAGAARNFGMQHAKGTYFIYVDSDCMLPEFWLKKINESLLENKYDAFGGPDTCHPTSSSLIKAINFSMTSFIGTGGTRGNIKSLGKFYPRSFNMGIHSKIFEKIGGMNSLRHGQDMDYSQRIYDAGFKVGLIPAAFVYHQRRTNLAKFYRQIFNWGVARINLAQKHPSILKPMHLLPAVIISIFVILIFLTFVLAISTKILWIIIAIGYGLIVFWSIIESLMRYRSITAALLSPITLNIQVFAYGLGLFKALWQIKVLGRSEAKGFVKKYY